MKNILFSFTILYFLLTLSSCGSSKISLGVTHDKGDYLQRSSIPTPGGPGSGESDTEKGRGVYIEYGWYKMQQNHGFGFDVNLHRNGYTDDGDGDSFTFQSLQGKYYYSKNLFQDRSKILLSLGLGGGRSKHYSGGSPLLVANVGADIYPFARQRFYIAAKANYFQRIEPKSDWGKTSVGLTLGLGVLIWRE